MKIILTAVAILLLVPFSRGQQDEQFKRNHAGIHKVVVQEVLQTTSYTYLLVKENDNTKWLAIPKIEANAGETYFYQGGNEMKDFKSSQLNRTFESVLFLGGVVKADEMGKNKKDASTGKAKTFAKLELNLEPVEGGVTIADLYANKSEYAGKVIKVKGQVVQFSSSIMGRNWIHLQDGTEHNGVFDLVITSKSDISVGDVVVLEGKISLDKDFGYGYFYELIMEDAQKLE